MKKLFFFIISSVILLQGCTKLIDVGSTPNQLTTDKVFADTGSAVAAMVSTYALFNVFIDPSYNVNMSLYTDELSFTLNTQDFIEFYQSRIPVVNGTNSNIWSYLYFAIYQCNDIIAQLKNSTTLPASYVSDLSCEAKFLRAYAYFYLVNFYGHIPLLLTTDVNTNAHAANTDSVTVFQQMVTDLKDAQAGLSEAYRGDGKVRANRYAATALLARVYLEQRDWANAETQAGIVLNSGLFTPLQTPGNVFLANSQETILSFWTKNGYIADGPDLVPGSGAPEFPVSPALLNAFEPGDLRRTNWLASTVQNGVTYYFPYKYHNRSPNTTAPEYLMALRSGEQYLIRAEARAQQGNIAGRSEYHTNTGRPCQYDGRYPGGYAGGDPA